MEARGPGQYAAPVDSRQGQLHLRENYGKSILFPASHSLVVQLRGQPELPMGPAQYTYQKYRPC